VVMAGLAQQHSSCAARQLHAALLTYDVVPASPRLGLLGFVEVGYCGVLCCFSGKGGLGKVPLWWSSCRCTHRCFDNWLSSVANGVLWHHIV
jgi:hypothetical protein